jgi:hypothetical protein
MTVTTAITRAVIEELAGAISQRALLLEGYETETRAPTPRPAMLGRDACDATVRMLEEDLPSAGARAFIERFDVGIGG